MFVCERDKYDKYLGIVVLHSEEVHEKRSMDYIQSFVCIILFLHIILFGHLCCDKLHIIANCLTLMCYVVVFFLLAHLCNLSGCFVNCFSFSIHDLCFLHSMVLWISIH